MRHLLIPLCLVLALCQAPVALGAQRSVNSRKLRGSNFSIDTQSNHTSSSGNAGASAGATASSTSGSPSSEHTYTWQPSTPGMAAPRSGTTSGTTSSSVTCIASGSAQSYSSFKSACVQAVASVMEVGCRRGSGPELLAAIDKAKQAGYAEAFAAVITKAITSCHSSGDAKGCASATAEAKSAAMATAQGFAQAVARGFSTCTCLRAPDGTIPGKCSGHLCKTSADVYNAVYVEAWAKATAALYVKLTAFAESLVSAHVCVEGNEQAYSQVEAKCVGKAAATIMAKAVASILITTDCYAGTSVEAEVKAVVDADITVSADCDTVLATVGKDARGFLKAQGTAIGKVAGVTGTQTERCIGEWCVSTFTVS